MSSRNIQVNKDEPSQFRPLGFLFAFRSKQVCILDLHGFFLFLVVHTIHFYLHNVGTIYNLCKSSWCCLGGPPSCSCLQTLPNLIGNGYLWVKPASGDAIKPKRFQLLEKRKLFAIAWTALNFWRQRCSEMLQGHVMILIYIYIISII